jgi:signal transduction histidine kinase
MDTPPATGRSKRTRRPIRRPARPRLVAPAAPIRPVETSGRLRGLLDATAPGGTRPAGESFLDAVSHELRTPITTIFGGARMLRRDGVPDAIRSEIADAVASEADRLYRLVEDLLAIARMADEPHLAHEPVLLQRSVQSVVRSDGADRLKAVRLRLEIPQRTPAAVGDWEAVRHVTRNLLTNAAQFSPARATVTVRLSTTESEVELRVLDAGPGVDPDEAELLFEPFYRSKRTGASAQGAGLGLAACRGLVEAMGGRVWARPRQAGAEFGFSLPRSAEE